MKNRAGGGRPGEKKRKKQKKELRGSLETGWDGSERSQGRGGVEGEGGEAWVDQRKWEVLDAAEG